MTIERYRGAPLATHEGVRCDGCGETPLRGTRRRCLLCIDADFCASCCEIHRHDCFIVIPKPAHEAWSETLQLITCFASLAGADEFWGDDGLNAPPPAGLNDRLRAFIDRGAHAICPPGPALCPVVNPASHLERLARSRRIAHARDDARRLRARDASEASRNEILNPRLFDVVDELHPWNMPRNPATPGRFASQGLIAYLPRRQGGGVCLVSNDGFPMVMIQVYAVEAKKAERVDAKGGFFGDVDGVASALAQTEKDGEFRASFAKGGVEVRAILTNVSSLCSVRIAARRCDARGACEEDGAAPVFESELGPLESAEHAAEGTEGRALLLGSTGASDSYVKFTVSPTEVWSAAPLTNAMWEGSRWHALDMFVAKRRAPDAPRRGSDWPWFGVGGIPVISETDNHDVEDEIHRIRHVGVMAEHRGLSPEELRLKALTQPNENDQNADEPSAEEPAPFVAGMAPRPPASPVAPSDEDDIIAIVSSRLNLGRVVAEACDPPPAIRLPALRRSPNPSERSAVLRLAVEPNLTLPPVDPECVTRRNAAKLIVAARDRELVDVYERAARGAHQSDACVVCLESEPACDLILLPCKHQCMHAGCMSDLVRRCPLCRVSVEWTLIRDVDGRISSRQHGWSYRGHVERQRVR